MTATQEQPAATPGPEPAGTEHSQNCGVTLGIDCGRYCWCLCHIAEQDGKKCWSCTRPVGSGYRIVIYLTGMKQSYFRANVCWPCFNRVTIALGEKGKGQAYPATACQTGRDGQGDIPVHPSVKAMSRGELETGFSQAVVSVFQARARIDELEASLRIAEYRACRAEDERDAVLAAEPDAAGQASAEQEPIFPVAAGRGPERWQGFVPWDALRLEHAERQAKCCEIGCACSQDVLSLVTEVRRLRAARTAAAAQTGRDGQGA